MKHVSYGNVIDCPQPRRGSEALRRPHHRVVSIRLGDEVLLGARHGFNVAFEGRASTSWGLASGAPYVDNETHHVVPIHLADSTKPLCEERHPRIHPYGSDVLVSSWSPLHAAMLTLMPPVRSQGPHPLIEMVAVALGTYKSDRDERGSFDQ